MVSPVYDIEKDWTLKMEIEKSLLKHAETLNKSYNNIPKVEKISWELEWLFQSSFPTEKQSENKADDEWHLLNSTKFFY